MIFIKTFLFLTFVKVVLLGVLTYHDLNESGWMYYLIFESLTSCGLLTWRYFHLDEKYENRRNVVNAIVYSMRTVAIVGLGILWEHHSYRKASFAFLFIIVMGIEVVKSIAGGISRQTYAQIFNSSKRK